MVSDARVTGPEELLNSLAKLRGTDGRRIGTSGAVGGSEGVPPRGELELDELSAGAG